MLTIFPVSYELETKLNVKKVARKIDGEIVEKRPSANVLSAYKFVKNHRFESVYYGCRTSENSFRIFYHLAKKRDVNSTGFYGKMEKTEKGTRIYGKFRKPIVSYVFSIIWFLITAIFAIVALSLNITTAFIAGLLLCFGGLFFIFYDNNSKKMLRMYLNTFPQAEENSAE